MLKILCINSKVKKRVKEDIGYKHNLIDKIVIVPKIQNISKKRITIFR